VAANDAGPEILGARSPPREGRGGSGLRRAARDPRVVSSTRARNWKSIRGVETEALDADDIIGDIMDPRKLEKLRRELEGMRRRSRSIKPSELEVLAQRLGRSRVKRGKEPTYERSGSGWFPLTIPSHPGTLAVGTACSILDQLEEDIDRLEAEGDERGGNGDDDPT
jgi:hypothetical protein